MADHIHNVLREFRDTMMTAVARLEFQIRDLTVGTNNRTNYVADFENTIQSLVRRMDAMEVLQRDSGRPAKMAIPETPNAEEILKMHADENTRNVIVSNVTRTPALSAAVAAATAAATTVPPLELSAVAPVEMEEGNWVKEPEETEEAEAEEEEDGSVEEEQLKKVVIQGVSYYMDADRNVYHETEEGYEQVGIYNPQTDSVELVDEEAEEEDEEAEGEAVEVEEFVYKGRTYQRDDENNVYEDGELIGTWNGKSIEPLETTEA